MTGRKPGEFVAPWRQLSFAPDVYWQPSPSAERWHVLAVPAREDNENLALTLLRALAKRGRLGSAVDWERSDGMYWSFTFKARSDELGRDRIKLWLDA